MAIQAQKKFAMPLGFLSRNIRTEKTRTEKKEVRGLEYNTQASMGGLRAWNFATRTKKYG